MKLFTLLISLVTGGYAKSPFYIALKQQNIDQVYTRLETVSDPENSNYGNYMSADKIRQLVSPNLQDVIPVMNFVKDSDCTWYGDMIKCNQKSW